MAKVRNSQSLSRVDGVGLSVAALDMLFCALGAVMLIFAMQERVILERSESEENHARVSSLQRITKVLNEESGTRTAQWAGVQALPELSGEVVFVLDLSGSLANEAQRRAQRHLVTQYVLQSKVSDFSVVHFAGSVQTLLKLGQRTKSEWVGDLTADVFNKYENDVLTAVTTRMKQMADKGIPATELVRMRKTGIMEKLSWFDIIMRHNLTRVGGGTRIDEALSAAVSQASSVTSKPNIVLISDGQVGTSASDPQAQYFQSPGLLDDVFDNRIAVSLVNPGSGRFSSGVLNMDAFVSGSAGRHVLINGYGAIQKSPELPNRQQSFTTKPDVPLEGATR